MSDQPTAGLFIPTSKAQIVEALEQGRELDIMSLIARGLISETLAIDALNSAQDLRNRSLWGKLRSFLSSNAIHAR